MKAEDEKKVADDDEDGDELGRARHQGAPGATAGAGGHSTPVLLRPRGQGPERVGRARHEAYEVHELGAAAAEGAGAQMQRRAPPHAAARWPPGRGRGDLPPGPLPRYLARYRPAVPARRQGGAGGCGQSLRARTRRLRPQRLHRCRNPQGAGRGAHEGRRHAAASGGRARGGGVVPAATPWRGRGRRRGRRRS